MKKMNCPLFVHYNCPLFVHYMSSICLLVRCQQISCCKDPRLRLAMHDSVQARSMCFGLRHPGRSQLHSARPVRLGCSSSATPASLGPALLIPASVQPCRFQPRSGPADPCRFQSCLKRLRFEQVSVARSCVTTDCLFKPSASAHISATPPQPHFGMACAVL